MAFTDFAVEGLTFRGPVDESPATPKRGRPASGPGAQTAVFLSGDLDTTGSGQARLTIFTMRDRAVRNMTALPISDRLRVDQQPGRRLPLLRGSDLPGRSRPPVRGVRRDHGQRDRLRTLPGPLRQTERPERSRYLPRWISDHGPGNPTDWAEGITVVGNHIRRAARAGVYLNGVRHVQVTGNQISDVGTARLADGTTVIGSGDLTQNIGILMENPVTSADVTVALNSVVATRATRAPRRSTPISTR
ncbi:hypothetical protein QFZ76_006110 [Streptomyces sp. V4I2]|nr:hypothetical protein [Streptomyces sp. V4I2]